MADDAMASNGCWRQRMSDFPKVGLGAGFGGITPTHSTPVSTPVSKPLLHQGGALTSRTSGLPSAPRMANAAMFAAPRNAMLPNLGSHAGIAGSVLSGAQGLMSAQTKQ